MPDRSVVYRLKADITNFRAGLAQASAATRKAAGDMTAATKEATKYRAGLTTVGTTAGKVGLVAAAGLGAVIIASARFDKSMSAVQAATHESSQNMELLRAAAIKAGADTQYSATEAAGAIEELAKAGVSTKDILTGGLSGALNLASAGAIGVSDAAELAATAMTQFSLSGNQVNHVADLLAAGAGKAQGGVDDLGMALKQSGLVAAQTGLSIEETVGALSEFASAGLSGSDAGTSFKTMLQALTPNSAQAAQKMADLGISAYDAQGNFIGMTKFAGNLKDSLSKLSVEQQNAALKTIFGSDAVRAASIIFRDGADGVAKWQAKVNDAGYAAETAGTRMDNLAGDFEQLKGSIETALIGAGDGAQGPLRKLTQGATTAVNALNSIPTPAKNAATGLLAVTAVAGGGVYFGAKVVSGIASMKAALVTLGITAEGTRAKLALVGSGAGAAALGVGTLVDVISQMDSIGRSRDAADATVKSFQDLSDALSYSNVGKYASDLHINLDRLTQDLYANGTKGEYASRVLDQLSESSHGFGAMLSAQAGTILPFYTSGADKAYDANRDLKAIIDSSKGSIGENAKKTTEAGTAAEGAAGKVKTLTSAQKAVEAAQQAAAKAAAATADAFLDLSHNASNAKVSLNGYIRQQERAADALLNFANNAEIAANRGLNHGLIEALRKLGPEGALRMRQLANATDSQIGRANRAWTRGQGYAQNYTDAVRGGADSAKARIALMRAEIDRLKDKRVHLDEKGSAAAAARIRQLQAAINALRGNTVIVNAYTRNHASTGSIRVSADGGTVPSTGRGYADRHHYLLADGEEVISNRYGQADRHRELLKAINSNRLADGGSVGRSVARIGGAPPLVDVGSLVREMGSVRGEIAQLRLEVATHPERTGDRVGGAINGVAGTVQRRSPGRTTTL